MKRLILVLLVIVGCSKQPAPVDQALIYKYNGIVFIGNTKDKALLIGGPGGMAISTTGFHDIDADKSTRFICRKGWGSTIAWQVVDDDKTPNLYAQFRILPGDGLKTGLTLFGGHGIHGLPDPQVADDAATKGYVDSKVIVGRGKPTDRPSEVGCWYIDQTTESVYISVSPTRWAKLNTN